MLRKIWLTISAAILLGLGFAFWRSPFIHAEGPFAQFQQGHALPALLIGAGGTAVIAAWGYLLMRNRKADSN